jgi:adenosine 3'-phospho 5'-phosphosulfate transporter B3
VCAVYGWYLTFFELVCFSAFAVMDRAFISHEPLLSHTAGLGRHGVVAAAMTASRGLTNVSLQFLNYPTQIIFKSMKLITVMVGSLFILNASFTVFEYLSAVCLVVAACMFSLGDSDTNIEFPVKGIVIVCLSLVGDAIHSTTQDALLREHRASTSEMMLFTNAFAAAACLLYISINGELSAAIAYCQLYPQAYALFVLRSAVIYLGVLCFALMIKSSGVVVATGVTTVRKIISILLSFLFFPKPWSSKYMWGGALFAASLMLSLYDQKNKKRKAVDDKRTKAAGAERR